MSVVFQADARSIAKEAFEAAENKEEKDVSAYIKVPEPCFVLLARTGGSVYGVVPAVRHHLCLVLVT